MTANVFFPLEYLASGEWAEVEDVTGDPGWVARMAELGLRVGTRIHMLRPGSPCLCAVDGARLSLRFDQAMMILVRPLANDCI
jgi:ferrous iron transport protein A